MILGVVCLLFFIPVCGLTRSTLTLNIRFDRIQGLQEGDRVIFEQNPIGDVTSVSYGKDGMYTVEIAVKKNFVNAITEHSKFYISDDPQTVGKKAVEVEQIQKGGTPLENGSFVEGSNKFSLVFEQLAMDIEKALEYLKKEFDDYQNEIKTIPESEEYQKLKRELAELLKQLRESGEETHEKIRKELIPFLIQELEKLKERLRKFETKEEKGRNLT
jgi:ABC-type transporter Mla subunit MlaD